MALDNSAIVGGNSNVPSGILAKLAKINELQKGATTEGEALTAAKLLQQLLVKHKLEMSDIEAVELNRDEPVEKEYLEGSEYGFRMQKRVAWAENLAGIVARAHFCRIMVVTGSNTIVFVGRKSDRDVAKRIFIYLAAAARQLVEDEARNYSRTFTQKFDWEKPDVRGFKNSFFTGFANKIEERYQMQRNELEAAAKTAAEGEARARREADIENAVAERNEQIEALVLELIDSNPEAESIDELVAAAQERITEEVKVEFASKPLDVNPMGLMRLKTAEKDVEEWFQERSRGRGRIRSARGVGYRRSHNSAGYSRGQAQGGGISMSGNVLR